MVFRRRIPGGKGELVVRIERRSMAAGTAFARKYLLAGFSAGILGIRVFRRLQSKQVLRQGEEYLIWKPSENAPALIARNPVRSEIGDVTTRHQRGITHQIGRSAQTVGCRMVDVLSVPNADKVRYLRRVKWASVKSGDDVDRHSEFLIVGGSHRLEPLMDIILQPWDCEPAPIGDSQGVPRRYQLQSFGQSFRREDLANKTVRRSIQGSAIQHASIRHDVTMTAGTLLNGES